MAGEEPTSGSDLVLHFQVRHGREIEQDLPMGENLRPAVVQELEIADFLVAIFFALGVRAIQTDAETGQDLVLAAVLVFVEHTAFDGALDF